MVLILLILTAIVTGLQIDNFKAESRLLKIKAWVTLGVLVTSTVIAYFVQKSSDAAATAEKQKSDSIADIRVKNSTTTIIDSFGKAIGEYSLGYDSAKNEIVKLQKLIKDSANRKTTIIQGDNPTIAFSEDGIHIDSIKNNVLYYSVSVISKSAASILKNANVYFLYSPNEGTLITKELHYFQKSSFSTKNMGFAKDGGFVQTYTLFNIKEMKSLIILLKGKYTDSYGKNEQEFDQVGILDLLEKRFGIVIPPYDDQIRDFLKNKGIL